MFTFLLASTTNYGVHCATSLIQAGFVCLGVITPAPRKAGRKQMLSPSQVDLWAQRHHIPRFYPQGTRLPLELKKSLPTVDFLLVVDFGYYIPTWLAHFPQLLSVNIHPSQLPAYRGASPGQHVLLHGERQSAVSIITIAPAMDAGDLLVQLPLTVAPTWNAGDYYDAAFALASRHLAATLTDYAHGQLTLQPQVGTPSFAPKITKADAFIEFSRLADPQQAATIERQVRAYNPWPHTWTIVPTAHGPKRMQLLAAHLDSHGRLILDRVKLEGETSKPWTSVERKLTPTAPSTNSPG